MRRARTIAALALVTMLAFAGCTQSDGGDGTTQDTRPPPGTRWADAFCIAYGDWSRSISRRLASVLLLDPAQGPAAAHTALTQVAAGARDDTTTTIGAIDAAGEPSVTDGSVIAVDVIHAFREALDAFTAALQGLQSVNPNDPGILIPGASGVRAALVGSLANARNDLAAALSEPHADELTQAFAAADACDKLFDPPT